MHIARESDLSVAEKIGQLFFIGIPGDEFAPETKELIQAVKPGGVCLFARNIRDAFQTRKLLDSIRANSVVEPLLSVDQEGGLVDRIKRIFTPTPAAGALCTGEHSATVARITAETLLLLGFNMNFAPVVDVMNDERRTFSNGLYSRAFGNSADEAALLAASYLIELQLNGCIGCIKHFPGLGASTVDSHDELPVVETERDAFFNLDLLPYRKIIGSGHAEAVMVAHAAFPNLNLQEAGQDGKLLPSSLDHAIVTNLLRHELGFNGIVITDDLEMGAIIKNFGVGEACVKAILAGCDMLAICAGVESIREGLAAITEAVVSGRVSEERMEESLSRILAIKRKLKKPPVFDIQRFNDLSSQMEDFRNILN